MEIKSLHAYFVCASSDVRIQSLIICAKSHKEHTWGNRGLTWLTGPILILIHPQSRYCHNVISFRSVHGGWRSISNAPKFKAGFSTYRIKNKPWEAVLIKLNLKRVRIKILNIKMAQNNEIIMKHVKRPPERLIMLSKTWPFICIDW